MVAPVIAAIEEAAKAVVEIAKAISVVCELTKQPKSGNRKNEIGGNRPQYTLPSNDPKRSR
ncbi:Uncharacterised protein [uncultured archaeon]|nr:Uncharacterised protein [uncultured archaeon]